jgi:acetoin utilization deacetylase AcuC-like enzyme
MPPLAIIKDDRYLEHNPGEGHPESPNRLRAIYDLIDREFAGLPVIPPRLATESELALVHDPLYIHAVARTEGRVHSQLDPDTGLSARSYEIARLAAGGLLNGIDALLNPQSACARRLRAASRVQGAIHLPQSIFAFVRPPGHHAEADRAMGFCLFNNIAIAAAYAKEKHGLKRTLIVDWDLHHGNGTQHSFYDDPSVLFFSSHQYPYYPGSGNYDQAGSGAGEGFTVNAPFPAGFGDAEYVRVYSEILKPIALEYRPELVLVSAGFDPYYQDPLGGMRVTGDGFGALAFIVRDIANRTCGGKVLITLEGGYSPHGLREGVRSVLNILLGQAPPPAGGAPSPAAKQVVKNIAAIHGRYWRCFA